MVRFGILFCAALVLSGASAAQVMPPDVHAAPEASWLATMASGVQPMPLRWTVYPIRLRPIVLDLRGPEPPVFQFAPMLGEPPQVRRQRGDEDG